MLTVKILKNSNHWPICSSLLTEQTRDGTANMLQRFREGFEAVDREQRIPPHSNDAFESLFLIIGFEIEAKRPLLSGDRVMSERIRLRLEDRRF